MKKKYLPLFAAATALTLTACGATGSEEGAASSSESTQEVTTLTVGASVTPHAEILEFVNDNLAADAGIALEIVEYTDYVQPNVALAEGELDANYFQHVPYLEAQIADEGYEFSHSVGIHIEPFGVYSDKYDSIADIPNGATISVPNDPSNQARALWLLEDQGLFTVEEVENPTIHDLADNPKNIQLTELEAAQLTLSLPDVDASVINGNYALQADLVPSEDALALESGVDNPYANIVAYRTEDEDNAAIATLIELLTSEETRAFIEETWPNGEVIPAF